MPEETQQLEQEIKTKKTEVDNKVEEAADKAKKEAEAKGATPEEVKEAVEKARKEEKDKLYTQIDSLKTGLKEVQDILKTEREEKQKIKKEVEAQAEIDRQAKLSDQEKTNEMLQKLEEQLKNERKEREKFRKELEDTVKKDELRRYKETLIKANENEIIPELVIGDTKEELDIALEVAKARFKEYAEKFQQRHGDQTRHNMPRSTNPDLEALEELELSKDLTALDTDKYLKDENYRKQIQAELENEYSRLAGRR